MSALELELNDCAAAIFAPNRLSAQGVRRLPTKVGMRFKRLERWQSPVECARLEIV